MRVPLPEAFLRAPITHRGYHDRARGVIENSVSAFRAAIEAGYGIELDVLLSRDGVVMVFHDDDMERLTEVTGFLADYSAAELGKIVLKGGSDTIPTLAEVLKVIDGRVTVLIELKDPTHRLTPTDGRLEAGVAQVLADYRGPAAVMSFNPHSVIHMARLAPDIPRGLVLAGDDPAGWSPATRETFEPLMMAPDYDRSQSSFVSHGLTDLDRPRIRALKAAGEAILCWTVRSPQAEAEARRIVHNITFEGYAA